MADEAFRVVKGNAAGTQISIGDEFLIGRVAEGEGKLGDDPELSRQHARVTRAGDAIRIEDLGSTNGTVVNGQRITSPHAAETGRHGRGGHDHAPVRGRRRRRPQVTRAAAQVPPPPAPTQPPPAAHRRQAAPPPAARPPGPPPAAAPAAGRKGPPIPLLAAIGGLLVVVVIAVVVLSGGGDDRRTTARRRSPPTGARPWSSTRRGPRATRRATRPSRPAAARASSSTRTRAWS